MRTMTKSNLERSEILEVLLYYQDHDKLRKFGKAIKQADKKKGGEIDETGGLYKAEQGRA